jgi:DNA-binding HxlR family transcriptional regulator
MATQAEPTRTMLPVHQAGECSVAAASEIVGSKWTVLIVHDLSEGPRRFTELEHACAGISPRTLAERLRWLESEEIVVRRSYAESPPRVEYELTGKGAALQPIIDEMRRFGHEWLGCAVHSPDVE